MPRAGTAYIRIEGDFTPFHRQLAKEGRNLSRKIDVKANVKADTSGLRNLNRSLDDTSRKMVVTERRARGLGGSITGVNAQMAFLRNVFRVIKWPAIIAGFGTAAQAASAMAAGVVSLTSALAPLTGLLATIPTGLFAFGQGLGTILAATSGVGNALSLMNKEQMATAKNAKAAADQQRQAADTQRQAMETIRNASESLADAKRGEQQAQEDLTQAYQDAEDQLIDLRDQAKDAILGEISARRALKQAQREQQQAYEDENSTFLERQAADFAVREAEQQLTEAKHDHARAQRDLNDAEKKGIEHSDLVTAARRSLNDAQRQVTRSARDLKSAQDDAARSERDAAREASGLTTEAQNLQKQLADLPPAAREFARFLFDLKPELQEVREIAAKGLFPGVEDGIRAAMHNLPELKNVVDATAHSFGDIAEESGEFLGRKGLGRDFEQIGRANARRFEELADAGLDFGDALRHIAVEAEPLVDFLVDQVQELGEWSKESAKAGRQSGKMADFFKETRDVFGDVVDIGTDLATTLINIGKAAFPTGSSLLDELVANTKKLREWTESPQGKRSLTRYFEDAQPAIEETGRLISDFTTDFFSLADNPGLTDFIHVLRVELLPLLFHVTEEMTNKLGPQLVDLFIQFGKTMDEIGTPALSAFIDLVTEALSLVNHLFSSIPGLASAAGAALAGFSILRLLGIGSLTRKGAIGGLIKGFGTGLAEAFGIEMMSAESKMAWANAANLLKGQLRGGLKYAVGGALAAIGFGEILNDIANQDWDQAAFQTGGAIAGAIAGGIAGGLPGALAGAGIGAMLGGELKHTADEVTDLMTSSLDGVDQVLAMFVTNGRKGLKELFTHLKDTGDAIDIHVIQQWVAAGDITLEQAGIMIGALKDVNQEAARVAKQTAERSGIGLAQQIAADGEISTTELNDVFDQLQAFKPKARKSALEAMTGWLGVLRNMGELSGREFNQMLGLAEDKFGNIDTTIKGHGKDAAEALRGTWKGALDDFQKHGRDMEDTARKHYSSVSSIMGEQTDKGADSVDTNMGRAKTEGSDSARSLDRNVSASVRHVADATYLGFKNIGENANKALSELKVKKALNFSLQQVGAAIGQGNASVDRAKGGLVPGFGSGDKVPLHIGGELAAMVEPNEYVSVANRAATAALMRVNNQIPRRAFGGIVKHMQSGGWLGTVGGVQLDKRIIPDAQRLMQKYKLAYTAGYAPSGHAAGGEHPLGLALDIVPGPGGSWGTVAQLANYAEPSQDHPIDPWRWVGWTGDAGHGPPSVNPDNAHLHLSWAHTGGLPPPVPSVETLHGRLGAVRGVVERIKRQILKGPDSPYKDIGQRALDEVRKSASRYVNSLTSPLSTPTLGVGFSGKPYHGSLDRLFPQFYGFANSDGQYQLSSAQSIMLARKSGFGDGRTRRGPSEQDVIAERESQRFPGIISDRPTDRGYGLLQHSPVSGQWGSDALNIYNALGGNRGMSNPWHNYEMGYWLDTHSVGDPWTATAKYGGVVSKLAQGGTPAILSPWALNTIKRDKLLTKIQALRGKTKTLDERVSNAQIIDAMLSSPAGSDLSESERTGEITLLTTLLNTLITRSGLITRVLPLLDKKAGRRHSLQDELIELQGTTGEGGRILETRAAIDALGGTAGPVGQFDWMQYLDLLNQKLAAATAENFLLRTQMPVFTSMHDGGVVPGPMGVEVPIIAQGGERVTPIGQDPVVNVTVIAEDGFVDPKKVRVVVNDEVSSAVRSAERMTTVPGRRIGGRP